MKYYIIAGERSGDLHGGNLIKALKTKDPQAEIRCWGGEEMQKAGGELVVHYKEMAYMGFWEVLVHLRAINQKIKFCKEDISAFQPDAVILIDYAGFNLRIAKFSNQHNIPVHYYISPKIWAWNQKRAFKIKKFVDHMYVILPFEKDFYRKFDFEVEYVGNPLLDAIRAYQSNKDFQYKGQNVVAVLPGSRKQEVRSMMDNLKGLALDFPQEQFVIAGVSNLEIELYDGWQEIPNVDLIFDQTYDLLAHSKAAVVTSGTATLETALFEVPQVVVYKTGKISFAIAKRLVKVEFISLVNLILNREAVCELIQDDFNPVTLKDEFLKILPQGEKRESIQSAYKELKEMLGKENTSEITAELMVARLQD